MTMIFLLDTNAVSELFKNNEKILSYLSRRVSASDEIRVSPITWFEIIRGRFHSVLTASDSATLRVALSRLRRDRELLSQTQALEFHDDALAVFDDLLDQKKLKKIGRADLLIACQSLAADATLVTRNIKDFTIIPHLRVENWAS
jgi:tRNA(fMet)-specific endonuclease VapC